MRDLTYEEGIDRIKRAFAKAKLSAPSGIVTSRDTAMGPVIDALRFPQPPTGFRKWQLPVFLGNPSQMFVSVGAPDAEIGSHVHEGDGLRYIVSGSLIYKGTELTQGDWMFVPKGQEYSFKVGARGVHSLLCYECCCGWHDNEEWDEED